MAMEIDGGLDVDFAQQTQTFLQWFESLPGATFHPDIELVDLRGNGAGRGISESTTTKTLRLNLC
jgi:hypothetical protein